MFFSTILAFDVLPISGFHWYSKTKYLYPIEVYFIKPSLFDDNSILTFNKLLSENLGTNTMRFSTRKFHLGL